MPLLTPLPPLPASSRYTAQERNDARARLLALLPIGTTLYTIRRHRTPSGNVYLSPVLLTPEGPQYIHGDIAMLLDVSITERNAYFCLLANHAGLSTASQFVQHVALMLYPAGFSENGFGHQVPGNPDPKRYPTHRDSNDALIHRDL